MNPTASVALSLKFRKILRRLIIISEQAYAGYQSAGGPIVAISEFLQGHGWRASLTEHLAWTGGVSSSPESRIINLAVADGSYDQGAKYNTGGAVPPANAIPATGDAQARIIGILPVPQNNARPTSPAKPGAGANLAPMLLLLRFDSALRASIFSVAAPLFFLCFLSFSFINAHCLQQRPSSPKPNSGDTTARADPRVRAMLQCRQLKQAATPSAPKDHKSMGFPSTFVRHCPNHSLFLFVPASASISLGQFASDLHSPFSVFFFFLTP